MREFVNSIGKASVQKKGEGIQIDLLPRRLDRRLSDIFRHNLNSRFQTDAIARLQLF